MELAHSSENALPSIVTRPEFGSDHGSEDRPKESSDEPARFAFGQMVGRSPSMQRLFSQMRHTARHLRVATIEGESGTGKMLAARALHDFGLGPQLPFVPCPASDIAGQIALHSAIALVGSAPRFAFSSLNNVKQSCGGTLVLTRVDQLSLAHQARLLELLQWIDHQQLLHAHDSIPRHILCLSSRPLRRLASTNSLRSDLAVRLAAIRFALPPLRDRREDISVLAQAFVQRFSATYSKPVRGLAPQTLARLIQHAWPGNVRELESVIHAAALDCPGQWIRPIDLPAFTSTAVPGTTSHKSSHIDSGHQPASSHDQDANFDPDLDRAMLRHIHRVLERAEGNKFRAAKMLGISRSTLYRMLDSACTAQRFQQKL